MRARIKKDKLEKHNKGLKVDFDKYYEVKNKRKERLLNGEERGRTMCILEVPKHDDKKIILLWEYKLEIISELEYKIKEVLNE